MLHCNEKLDDSAREKFRKKWIIKVKGSEISIYSHNQEDYISLTDMVRSFEGGLVLIEKWLRNINTIEFSGSWEQFNPRF